MNQMNFLISELMSFLQSAEGVIKLGGNVLNVERASTSASMPKGKKGKKKKPIAKGPKVGSTPKIGKSKGKGKGKKDGKGKGNCFQYGILGHWKRDCPNFLAMKVQGMIESQVVEVSFITDTLNTWCIDSGTTNHICNTLQGFRSTRQCHDVEVKLTLAYNATILAITVGVVVFKF